jgi:hypothetical protein
MEREPIEDKIFWEQIARDIDEYIEVEFGQPVGFAPLMR